MTMASGSPEVRPATPADLDDVARIQALAPEASQWAPATYLQHLFLVAVCENRVAGFAVARAVAPGENEILNLAVSPGFRRRGVASGLLRAILTTLSGAFFLEVRESNTAAVKLYHSLCFHEVGRRKGYYGDPPEAAIVLKFYSC
jgi:ribosomal-protein-alanine N-acetyltransferase